MIPPFSLITNQAIPVFSRLGSKFRGFGFDFGYLLVLSRVAFLVRFVSSLDSQKSAAARDAEHDHLKEKFAFERTTLLKELSRFEVLKYEVCLQIPSGRSIMTNITLHLGDKMSKFISASFPTDVICTNSNTWPV